MPESLSPESSMQRNTLRPDVRTYADNLLAQIHNALLLQGIEDPDDLSGPKAEKIPLEELKRIQALVHLLTNVREKGELPASELTFTVKDALNPYHEADPSSPERKDLTLNLKEVLAQDIVSYRASGMTHWAEALEKIQCHLSPEKRTMIEQELADGCIPMFMPGSSTQKGTTPEQYQKNLKPVWIKDGAPKPVADAYMWDYIESLIANKNASLIKDIPSRPYILLVKPSQKPEARTCSKTLDQQQAELVKINQERSGQHRAPVGSLKPLEYAALQQRFTALLKAHAPNLRTLSPLDSTTYTRFIDLPVAGGLVPYGYFLTDGAQVGFPGYVAVGRLAVVGFRSVVRVKI